jgi:hypothetical protein
VPWALAARHSLPGKTPGIFPPGAGTSLVKLSRLPAGPLEDAPMASTSDSVYVVIYSVLLVMVMLLWAHVPA